MQLSSHRVQEWSLRPATDDDRPGAVALLARSLPFDIADGPFRAVDAHALLASCWDPADLGGVPDRGVVRLVSTVSAGFLPGPDGVAVRVPAGLVTGSVAPPRDSPGPDSPDPHPPRPGSPGGGPGHVHLLAVHPDQRGRGLGRALLDGVTAGLAGLGADSLTTEGRPPRYGWPGADVRYTPFGLLLESAGWAREQTSLNMTVDLDAASRDGLLDTAADLARLAGLGIGVRRAGPADAAAVTAAATAFAEPWAAEAAGALGADHGGVEVALRGTRVVGFACHGSSRPGWFGPTGVDPAERLGGIGAVLLRRCLVDIRAQGRASAQICWVGPERFYARTVGAYVDRTFAVHTRTC